LDFLWVLAGFSVVFNSNIYFYFILALTRLNTNVVLMVLMQKRKPSLLSSFVLWILQMDSAMEHGWFFSGCLNGFWKLSCLAAIIMARLCLFLGLLSSQAPKAPGSHLHCEDVSFWCVLLLPCPSTKHRANLSSLWGSIYGFWFFRIDNFMWHSPMPLQAKGSRFCCLRTH
jgi:hypothetical protein